MSDLRLNVVDGVADLDLDAGDLELDPGLRTGVLVSLFSDARLPEEREVPDGTDNRRGWWGTAPGGSFGSLVWAFHRGKLTTETLEGLREACEDALAWLIGEGIVEEVAVEATRSTRNRNEVALRIELRRGRATRWPALWEGVQTEALELGGVELLVLGTS